MISVLFGMMLSLEPVNISGLKSGYAQFEATILGGFIMAVIISIGGVNFITVPLGVVLTLYISILLDWKNISPVAFFTSIYMSQLIQFTSTGEASMLLTFRLRIMALGAGVLVAILLNFIFSLLFYKSMVKKRIIYLLEKLQWSFSEYKNASHSMDPEALIALRTHVSRLFNDIDFVYGHVSDLRKEKKKKDLNQHLKLIEETRDSNGICYRENFEWEAFAQIENGIKKIVAYLETETLDGLDIIEEDETSYKRMIECINRIVRMVK